MALINGKNKLSQNSGKSGNHIITNFDTTKMPPPSQIARNSIFKSPETSNSRIASLAHGPKVLHRDYKPKPSSLATNSKLSCAPTPTNNLYRSNATISSNSRIAPFSTSKVMERRITTLAPHVTNSNVKSNPSSRPNGTTLLNSRSSSVLSSVSSANTTTTKRTSVLIESRQIPDTNTIRKGLAKFSNPMECQRQFQALNSKISQLICEKDQLERDKGLLRDQLEYSIKIGAGYASTVQYYASKLKLDSEVNLLNECALLKKEVDDLTRNKAQLISKLENIGGHYETQLQIQKELRDSLEERMKEAQLSYEEAMERLKQTYQTQLDDLSQENNSLKLELETKTKELNDLRKEYENLIYSYDRLEESLTKDKDARVKFAHEKIHQLQQDVESLNSVLKMRSERIHTLEKESIMLSEVQNELGTCKDANKALNQQIESIKAALENKREQVGHLILEKEKLDQELKSERKERRRMVKRTEHLEYFLNESCAAENSIVNSTI